MSIFSAATLSNHYETLFEKLKFADGLAPLAFRLILGPVFIVAGFHKLGLSSPDAGFIDSLLAQPSIVEWFGNEEWGLGLPFPALMGFLAGWTEFLGGLLLLLGVFTRGVAVPLMFTMFIAATSVHWDNGWYAIAPGDASRSPTQFYQWMGIEAAEQSAKEAEGVAERVAVIRELVSNSRNPDWLTAKGNPVILQNGIEFSATYFVLLLSLFFTGGGRFTSVDYYLKKTVFK